MNSQSPTHLAGLDRAAFSFRVVGAIVGFAVIAFAFATSSWNDRWILMLLALVVIGGGVSYHLLTSVVRCPSCRNRVFNFRIGPSEEKQKHFTCRHCGAKAWISEGFYWQSDING